MDDYVDAPLNRFDELDNFIPTEVCHYTSMQTAMEKILSSKKLRMGEITSTNDPRESKKRSYFDVDWKNFGNAGSSSLENDLEYKIRKEWKVLCMTCHNNLSSNFMNYYEDEPSHKDHSAFGVSHSRMWAQYAGNHSGICFLFNGKKLDKSIRESLNGKPSDIYYGLVRYDHEQSTNDETPLSFEINDSEKDTRIRHSLKRFYKENFLYKSPEWKSEHEFRWLVHSKDIFEILIPIESSIKAVIVGADFQEVYMPSLQALSKPLKIPVGRITWFNGRPKVDFEKN